MSNMVSHQTNLNQNKVKNQQTQSTYDSGSWNWTQATLVEGGCFLRSANPALNKKKKKNCF